MTARRRRIALACALSLIATAAQAWNATGHRLIAAIAWERMTPFARAEAGRLLNTHPEASRWLRRATGDAPERQLFIAAATWPDEIRKDRRFYTPGSEEPTDLLPGFPDMMRHSDWHYEARPLDAATEAIARSHPHLQRGTLGAAITTQQQILGNRQASELARSYALPWIIHLVGDAHQPLHLSLRVNADGHLDKLGDLPIINPSNPRKSPTTLHVFWDDLPGPTSLRGEAFEREVDALLSRFPKTPRATESAKWLDESWQLARQNGYPETQDEVPTISETFFAQSREIARKRVAEAGYRLGRLLNALLDR